MLNQFSPERVPPLWEILALFIGGGVLAFVAARVRWWTAIVTIPAFQLMGMTMLATLQHPVYGGLIRAEHGTAYVVLAFFSAIIGGAVLPASGAVLGYSRRR